ncbi:FtsK/SpoIIIE domain-containing protein, partial [Listeria seeligeri]
LPSELDAVIDHIHAYTEAAGIEALPRPWLPPLPEQIFLPELHAVNREDLWNGDKQPLQATIGFLDIPQMQAQEPLTIDLAKDGHLAVFSSPGYGKSTFLQTVTMDLARQHNPARLHIYLLDLGTNGLLPLKGLPHVADTIMVDEEVKIGKLIRRLAQELKERKQKLSKYGVANISMYEKASKEEVPSILLVIDAFDSVGEAPYKEVFEKLIAQIAREGASVGIHLVLSAVRQNAIRVQMLASIKHQVPLFMIEGGEARSIVGKTELTIEELPGRGLIKLDEPTVFQTALPVCGEGTLDIIEKIQAESEEMANAWQGTVPEPIPMVPEVIHMLDYLQNKQVQSAFSEGKTPIAVDFEDVLPVNLDMRTDGNTLVLTDNADILERTMVSLVELMGQNMEVDIALYDNSSNRFQRYKNNVNIYAGDEAAMNLASEQMISVLEAREDAWKEIQRAAGSDVTLKMYVEELRPMYVVMTDSIYSAEQMSTEARKNIVKLIESGPRLGIYFITGSQTGILYRARDEISGELRKQKTGILLGRVSDQNVLSLINTIYKEALLAPYEAYYIKQGQYEKIKLIAPNQ